MPDLRQRTLALRAAPRSPQARVPAHVLRPDARSEDAALMSIGVTHETPGQGDPRCKAFGSAPDTDSEGEVERLAPRATPQRQAQTKWPTPPRAPRPCLCPPKRRSRRAELVRL